MTAPQLPLLTPLAPEPALAPAQPMAPQSVTPTAKPAGIRHASPFYLRYLNDQASSIRARGGDDTAVNHFLDLEEGKPFSGQVTGPTIDDLVGPDATPTHLRGISMAMLQGVTFGFGDEAVGALLGIATGVGARRGIDDYRREYADWAKDNHKTAIVAEIAGGFLLPGAGLAKSGGVLSKAGRALTPEAGAGIGSMARTAGVQGAAYGTGNATGDVSDRAWGALTGAAVGSLAGATLGILGSWVVAPAVERLAASVPGKTVLAPIERASARAAGRAVLTLTPEARARERLGQELLNENIDFGALETRLADLHRAGVPATVLDAAGDKVLGLARGVLADRSPLTTKLVEELQVRQGEQARRLPAALLALAAKRNRFGVANAHEVADALHADALTRSEPLYKEAFEQVVQITPRLRKLLQHPDIKRAYAGGVDIANTQDLAGTGHGIALKSLADDTDALMRKAGISEAAIERTAGSRSGGELPVRGIDYLKRGLRLVINNRMKDGTLDAEGAKALIGIRDEIVTEASKQVPAYAKALAAYSGPVGSRDAIRSGIKFLRMQPEAIAKKVAKLSPSDRDFARLGYVQAVYDKLLSGSDDVARGFFGGNLIGKPSLRMEQIRAIFPEAPEAAEAFARTLAGEARLSYTTGRVIRPPGATTVEKLEQEAMGNLPQARGTMLTTAASAGRTALQRFRAKVSKDEADELTHLFSKGLKRDPGDTGVIPRELRVLLDDLQYSYGGIALKRAARGAIGRATAQIVTR